MKRTRSEAQRTAMMDTCFARTAMMVALREWWKAWEGDGDTTQAENDLAAACRRYYSRKGVKP